jgi:hypothetical protein
MAAVEVRLPPPAELEQRWKPPFIYELLGPKIKRDTLFFSSPKKH